MDKRKSYTEKVSDFRRICKGPIKEIVGDRAFEDTINDIHVVDVVRINNENYKAAY